MMSSRPSSDVRSIQDRIDEIDKKFVESKHELRAWVDQQRKALDQEEDAIRNAGESIDVLGQIEPSIEIDDAPVNPQIQALLSRADELLAASEH